MTEEVISCFAPDCLLQCEWIRGVVEGEWSARSLPPFLHPCNYVDGLKYKGRRINLIVQRWLKLDCCWSQDHHRKHEIKSSGPNCRKKITICCPVHKDNLLILTEGYSHSVGLKMDQCFSLSWTTACGACNIWPPCCAVALHKAAPFTAQY